MNTNICESESKKTILLVDDETDIISILTLLYEDKYNILTATSGNKAFQIFKENHIDLILTDYQMEDGSGEDLAKLLLDYEKKPAPHLLLMTGNPQYANQSLEKLNFSSIFLKPLDIESLETVIHNFTKDTTSSYSRSSHRLICNFSISVLDEENNQFQGQVVDISKGGFQVTFTKDHDLSCNKSYKFELFDHAKIDCTLLGNFKPRWIQIEDSSIKIGVRFTEKTKNSSNILECYNELLTNKPVFCK